MRAFNGPDSRNLRSRFLEYSSPWALSQSGRLKQDYGAKVNFKKRKLNLDSFTGLPDYSRQLVERLRSLEFMKDFEPVELCNLEYSKERGSHIDPHLDDEWLWGERLVIINLSANCFFQSNARSEDIS